MANDKPKWYLTTTPNPAEFGVSVSVPMNIIVNREVEFPDIGDPFSQNIWVADRAFQARYANYVYTYNETGVTSEKEAALIFHYAKNKTPEERNTPFDTYPETQRIQWPAVLEWIQFGQETGFPLSQDYVGPDGSGKVTSPRWLVRRGYRPSLNLETQVLVQKYLSEVPWPDWAMVSDEPQPTEVSWDLVGSHGNMGRCLHPEVAVPTNSQGYRAISTAGVISSASSSYDTRQIFPRTNHLRWKPYEVVDVKKTDGQYLRIVYTYTPPARPRITEEKS